MNDGPISFIRLSYLYQSSTKFNPGMKADSR